MITHIIDNIYIGDCNDAEESQNIFEIFTVAKESEFKGQHFYHLTDIQNDENEFLLSRAIGDLIIARQGTNNILVHCVYGYSRSVAVILGYMIMNGWSFNNAFNYIKEHRSKKDLEPVMLNPHFKKLLREIEKTGKLYKDRKNEKFRWLGTSDLTIPITEKSVITGQEFELDRNQLAYSGIQSMIKKGLIVKVENDMNLV